MQNVKPRTLSIPENHFFNLQNQTRLTLLQISTEIGLTLLQKIHRFALTLLQNR
jgi:hypothetical protein